jgi:hypothetical protein
VTETAVPLLKAVTRQGAEATALPPVSHEASAIARHGGIAPTRFERLSNDNYFTLDAPWIVPALLAKVTVRGPVLEPAAGVGHLVRELRGGHGLEVIASDLHVYERPLVPDIGVRDIRAIDSLVGFNFVITNLPYQDQDELGSLLVALGARDGCGVALLTRAEWIVARTRRNLVHKHPNFAGVVHLTSRPRWSEVKIASPRHNFIWAVWSATPRPVGALPWVQFADRGPARRGARELAAPARRPLGAASSSS